MKKSIVITTYNGEKYIIEQLNSLKNQSEIVDEVLIFDDGSTDKTQDIISNFIIDNSLENWKFIINNSNKGWRRNFMEGFWASTGDIVFPCDQDDFWHYDKIKIMAQIMEENPQIELLASRYNHYFGDGKLIVQPKRHKVFLQKHSITSNFFDVPYPGCTYCIRRNLIEESRSVWFDLSPHDALLWRLALIRGTLFSCDSVLSNVRKHNSTFAIEAKSNHFLKNRLLWIDYGLCTVDNLLNYISKKTEYSTEDNEKILKLQKRWIEDRKKFLNSKNLFAYIDLMKYLKCYGSIKSFFGDFYVVYFNKTNVD